MWLETNGARILRQIFDALSLREDSANMMALASSLQNEVGRMGEFLAVSEALQLFRAVAPTICSYAAHPGIRETADTTNMMDRLPIAELYAVALISLLLGFSRELERLNPISLAKIVKAANPLAIETLYTGVILPRKIIEEMEFVRDRLEFEFRIEGKIVTPLWFQTEMAALGYVRFLAEATSAILQEVENTFGNEIRRQLEAQNHALAAELVQRGLEACQKLASHFAKFKTLYGELLLLNRSREYEWPKIDWDGFERRIAVLRQQLVSALAESSTELAKLPTGESWPDFFGHAYTVLSEECFTAMADGNEELFCVVFPAFFKLALEGNERLRKRFLADVHNIQLSIEPLADLMALSGYAAVFSELDNKNFWESVEGCWNQFFAIFDDDGQKRHVIQLLCLAIEPTLRMTPRSVMRTRWKQMSESVFVARGLISERHLWHGPRDSEANHPSALVRIFTRGIHLFNDPCVVFLALYAFQRPEATGLNKPRRVISLEEDLQRATQNDSASEDE
jgi:hypothetical protein